MVSTALVRPACAQHRRPHQQAEQAAVALSQVRGDDSGVDAVGGDAGAREPACKLAREQDVAELGTAVGGEQLIPFAGLQVVEIDDPRKMRHRCGVDDACRCRGEQALPQAMGQDEIGHVIEGEGALEPFRRDLPRGKEAAGIVDENVDAGLLGSDLRADPLDLRQQRKVGIMGAVRDVRRDPVQEHERLLGTIPIARNHYDAGAEPRQSSAATRPIPAVAPVMTTTLPRMEASEVTTMAHTIRGGTEVAASRPASPVLLRAVPKI
jgi:hypothetical protein